MLDQGMKFTLHKLHCIPYKKELERVDSRFLAAASCFFRPIVVVAGVVSAGFFLEGKRWKRKGKLN